MNAALLLAGVLVAQMPNGIVVKNILKDGRLFGRSIEIHRIVDVAGTPTRYFASRSKPVVEGGVLATIDSWSTMGGDPIRAAYRTVGLKVDVTFLDGKATFVGNGKRVVVDMPEGIPVLLSQLDPLLVTDNLNKTGMKIALIIPERCQVVPCTVNFAGKADIRQGLQSREGYRFHIKGTDDVSNITLDADGGFVRSVGDNGLEAKIDRWRDGDEFLFEMPRPF